METVHVDEIVPIIGELQINDLDYVLRLTVPDRRPKVVLAFLDLEEQQWARAAGLLPQNVNRWFSKQVRLPFGAALRLARVLGQNSELLFEGWMLPTARGDTWR